MHAAHPRIEARKARIKPVHAKALAVNRQRTGSVFRREQKRRQPVLTRRSRLLFVERILVGVEHNLPAVPGPKAAFRWSALFSLQEMATGRRGSSGAVQT